MYIYTLYIRFNKKESHISNTSVMYTDMQAGRADTL